MEKATDVTKILRDNEIPTELYTEYTVTPKLPPELTQGIGITLDKQLKYADKKGIPYVVIIGPEEAKKNVVKLKDMKTGEQEELTIAELVKKLV